MRRGRWRAKLKRKWKGERERGEVKGQVKEMEREK